MPVADRDDGGRLDAVGVRDDADPGRLVDAAGGDLEVAGVRALHRYRRAQPVGDGRGVRRVVDDEEQLLGRVGALEPVDHVGLDADDRRLPRDAGRDPFHEPPLAGVPVHRRAGAVGERRRLAGDVVPDRPAGVHPQAPGRVVRADERALARHERRGLGEAELEQERAQRGRRARRGEHDRDARGDGIPHGGDRLAGEPVVGADQGAVDVDGHEARAPRRHAGVRAVRSGRGVGCRHAPSLRSAARRPRSHGAGFRDGASSLRWRHMFRRAEAGRCRQQCNRGDATGSCTGSNS